MIPSESPRIVPLRADDVEAARAFALAARAETLGERVDPASVPPDLADLQALYLHGPGCLLLAKAGPRILGCIGYRPYDGRFPQLDLGAGTVVEVVRLYVRPALRRAGLAGRLFHCLQARAEAAEIDVLYLHTHPFLPGAEAFWTKQGFGVEALDTDPVWRTLHMSKPLRPRGLTRAAPPGRETR